MDRQNYIELVTVPFQAGESKLFAISGQYFELIDAVNPVDVVLTDKFGAQRGLMRQAEASFNLKATEFATVQLTSATAQTVRFAYGTGEGSTRRAAGAVSIVGTVAVSGPLTDAELRAQLVDVRMRPELPTNSWQNGGTMAANTPIAVINPGANVNGAIVWSAGASDMANATMIQTFTAKATPPSVPGDGQVIAQSNPAATLSTNLYVALDMQQPRRIAAGLGLYFISSVAGQPGFQRHARYTLL